jgi:SpoVK/Ycf46/Vps4 family AAA+-type ATPase
VLWIDEIEKSLSGSQNSAYTDGGTSARVLGTVLTWLQEKTAPVFVVATANNIEQLPLEMLRRGRFDETFFVDLPDARERIEILAIHLAKRGYSPADFAPSSLVEATVGFSGAELEQCVISGMFDAYSAGMALSARILERCAGDIVPLSRTMREPIERLRQWAEGRARRASSSMAARV